MLFAEVLAQAARVGSVSGDPPHTLFYVQYPRMLRSCSSNATCEAMPGQERAAHNPRPACRLWRTPWRIEGRTQGEQGKGCVSECRVPELLYPLILACYIV